MTRLEAHAHFAMMPAARRAFLARYATVEDGVDYFPALATALAGLSGWLADATDADGLTEAAAHGASLWEAGVLTDDEVADALRDVIGEVVTWGERLCVDS